MNDRNTTNARFIQVNQLPQIDSQLTAKLYVDTETDQTSLLRLDPNEKIELDNQDSITLNSTSTDRMTTIEIPTKAYIDSLHEENERSRRYLGIDFFDESNDLVKNNQDNDLKDNKLTNMDSITVNRNPTLDNELANKKNIDDKLDKNTVLRFNQTIENYLKVSVSNDTYNLTKYNKIQLTDTTVMKTGLTGGYLLPYWKVICNDKINSGKIQTFIKSTKTNSPTSESGATSLPFIGNAFMYIETSSNNHGNIVYVILQRTDIIQISNITFYYYRFSSSDDKKQAMGRFRIQLLLESGNWSSRYTIAKNTQCSDSSTEWTLINLSFTEENYGIRLYYDEIDSPQGDFQDSHFQTLQSHILYIENTYICKYTQV